jgi:hypothetical protein
MFFYLISIFIIALFVSPKLTNNLKYKLGVYGHMNTRIKEISQYKDVDILFLGSSHSYRGFDTRIFSKHNFKTFNLGSSSQTPMQTEILLNEYLDKLKPKLVIMEVYPNTFMSDGVESSIDLIINDKISLDYVKLAIDINNIKVYNTLIVSYVMDLFNKNKNFIEKKNIKDDKYISGGYVENKIKYFNIKKTYKLNSWKLKENQKKAFSKIIAMLKLRNIKFLLIQSPINSLLYNSFKNNSEIDRYFSDFGDYYNFNNILKLSNKNDFYDDDHLNQNGVLKFNKKLIELLIKNDYL